MLSSKLLIICPHADDEMFCIGFIKSRDNEFKEIDLLVVDSNEARLKEAKISASINNLNLINMPNNVKVKDSFFHLYLSQLIDIFTPFWNEYDLILAPMIEGGHQDHDSVTAALLNSKKRVVTSTRLLLYPSYRGLKAFPWLYRCGIPKDNFSSKVIYFSMPKKWIFYLIRTYIKSYRSQSSTWILLLPALLFALLKGELNKVMIGNSLTNSDIKNICPTRPFYQFHRNMTRSEWFKYLDNI